MKQIFRKKGYSVLLLFILITLIQSQQSIDPTPVAALDKPTVVQANRYYSSKEKSVNYNIVTLNKSLPVVILPKNIKTPRTYYTNKITLTLNDNQGNYISCTLEDNYQLCVLQKFNTEALSLVIQCQSLPCEFSWAVVQAPIQAIDTKNVQKASLKQLYAIQQSQQNKHLTIKVICDSPQLQKTFQDDVQFYANRQNYHKIKTQGITYFLFSNPPTSFKQYFYLKIQQKYRQCAQIQIFNEQEDITIDKKVTDFVRGNASLTYNIKNHTKNMRIDADLHLFSSQEQLKGQFKVRVDGMIGGVSQTIRKMTIQAKKKRNIQFSFTINNITDHYSDLKVVFQSTVEDSIIKLRLVSNQIQQVQKGEYSFLSLKKDQKVKYKIIAQKQAPSKEKVFIYNPDETKIKISKKQCSSRDGCEFQVQAVQNYDGSFYIGQSKTQNTQALVFFDIKKTFTKRVHQDTIIYLKKQVQEKRNYQIVVNTHNVILYAANQQVCKQPGPKCHQKVGNSQHPFIYSTPKKGIFLIAVHALDQSQFTVTIIQQKGQYPQLQDGVPFSYLMDDSEVDVIFKFDLPKKQDLTFNLVSPLNELVLYVFNGDKLPQKYNQKMETYTVDGYVYYPKSQIKSNTFIVAVRKLNPSKGDYVHFSLIASTKNSNIKLQAGVTHHQKLVKNEHQDFVLQFNTSKKYVVSFYIHDSVGQKVNVSLDLSKNDTYDSVGAESSFTIDRLVDQIDISQASKKICSSQELNSCEVFFRLKNKMNKDIGMQITLLTTNSIVQLHDGVWQYFPEQLTSTTTHFYFFPKHISNPLNILYQSNNPDLRILYSLTTMDVQTMNPEDWNFPSSKNKNSQKQILNLGLRQVKHISIGKQALKQCAPNCLLLMTLVKAQVVKGEFNEVERDKEFGILISNDIIDVPEKTKVEVVLQKGQQRYLKMNLKTVLQHDTLTAYVYNSLGTASLFANVCSQKNFRMPTKDEYDFSFGILQTQLRSATLKKKIDAQQISQTENPYLCLIAVTQQNTKFSIEYTSEQQIVNLLRLDEFKTVNVSKNNPKYFQVEASVEHIIKIVRNKGFPFIQQKKCTGKDISYEECLQDLQQSSDDNKFELVQKVKRYQYEPCPKCIVYLKISSNEPAEVDIHLQSKYTEMTLQQKKIVTDYLQKNQQNRYQVTAISNEAAYININVISGNIKCRIMDMNGLNLQKQSSSKQQVLHFGISPSQLKQKKQKSVQNPFDTILSGFGLQSIFTSLHISIVSTDLQKGASYTIQYSSGQRESYLQDGMVYKYKLQSNNPKNPAKFYYQNFDQNNHVYIFLGSKKSSQLSKLDINIYSMQSITDQEGKKLINSKIPELRKKSVKPTVLYPLPTSKFYSIQVINPTGSQIQLSVGVNHQQVIFLPYDIDYPFPLANKQNLNLIVDVQNKGYILLTFKKCDQSNVEISYTFDYEGFKQGQYQYTTTVNSNEPKFEQMIKTKQSGPLYITIKRDEPQGISTDAQFKNSVFSMNAKFSQTKLKTNDYMQPGNKGFMTYEILSNDKIKVQFTEVACESKSDFCSSKFQYFLVASNKMVDVYSQSVCPSTYFAEVQNSQKHPILPLRKILQKANSDHKITFQYQFEKSNPISYIAIKAVYKNKQDETIEVYYQPIEVATFWGQLQQATQKHGSKILVITGVVFAFCVFIICLRRQRRKGYQTIQQND